MSNLKELQKMMSAMAPDEISEDKSTYNDVITTQNTVSETQKEPVQSPAASTKHAGGRPKVYEEKLVNLNMKLEESISNKLSDLSKKTGYTKSYIVKNALIEYYKNHGES